MFKKRQSGFTITELLVVMFIIVTISSLMLANYRSGQKRYALSQAAQRSISDIRRAQNMAISGVDVFSGQYYGYGVYFNRGDDFYIIYGDENGNDRYDGSEEDIEIIYFPPQVEIQDVAPSPPNKLDVFFKSPNPTTYLNGDDSVGGAKTIILQLKDDSSVTKSILVTTAGLIQID